MCVLVNDVRRCCFADIRYMIVLRGGAHLNMCLSRDIIWRPNGSIDVHCAERIASKSFARYAYVAIRVRAQRNVLDLIAPLSRT